MKRTPTVTIHTLKPCLALTGMIVASLALVGVARGDVITQAVGVYDSDSNANAVDRVASDSPVNGDRIIMTWDGYEAFKTAVAQAFTAGVGGVADWEDVSSTSRDNKFLVNFANDTKQLEIDANVGTSGGARASTASLATAISGSRMLYPDGTGNLNLEFGDAYPIMQLGITVLDRTDRTGIFTVTAYFSDDQTASVSASLDAEVSDEDTFVGFIAPEGVSITRLQITGSSFMRTDDLGFIVVPEPGSVALMALGGLLLLARGRRHGQSR